jgi:hypothetical protein
MVQVQVVEQPFVQQVVAQPMAQQQPVQTVIQTDPQIVQVSLSPLHYYQEDAGPAPVRGRPTLEALRMQQALRTGQSSEPA